MTDSAGLIVSILIKYLLKTGVFNLPAESLYPIMYEVIKMRYVQ